MNYFNELSQEAQEELIGFTIDKLQDLKGCEIYGCDLHHEIFNTDYYIIGNWEAEQWLIKHIGIFDAIDIIKEYEEFHFGEIYTDLSIAEKVLNMLVYIVGEEILQESETLQNKWDEYLTEDDFDKIIEEVKAIM
jgi:hypothetical protein